MIKIAKKEKVAKLNQEKKVKVKRKSVKSIIEAGGNEPNSNNVNDDEKYIKEIKCIVLVPQTGSHLNLTFASQIPEHSLLNDLEPESKDKKKKKKEETKEKEIKATYIYSRNKKPYRKRNKNNSRKRSKFNR